MHKQVETVEQQMNVGARAHLQASESMLEHGVQHRLLEYHRSRSQERIQRLPLGVVEGVAHTSMHACSSAARSTHERRYECRGSRGVVRALDQLSSAGCRVPQAQQGDRTNGSRVAIDALGARRIRAHGIVDPLAQCRLLLGRHQRA